MNKSLVNKLKFCGIQVKQIENKAQIDCLVSKHFEQFQTPKISLLLLQLSFRRLMVSKMIQGRKLLITYLGFLTAGTVQGRKLY